MNSKSLILSVLLLGGLLTPQETKPASVIIFSVPIFFTLGIFSGITTIKNIVHPKRASDFIKNPNDIQSYSAHIVVKKRKNNVVSVLVDQHIQGNDPYCIVSQAEALTKQYEKQRHVRVKIIPSVTLKKKHKQRMLGQVGGNRFSQDRINTNLLSRIVVHPSYLTGNTQSGITTLGLFIMPFWPVPASILI